LKKWILMSVVGVLLMLGIVALAGYWWIQSYGEHPHRGSGATIAIDIPAGSGPRQTIELLAKNQVLDDADLFYRWVRFYKRAAGKFKSGELAFRDTMTPVEILAVLLEGIPITHKMTIPEGLRIDEIAQLFAAAGLAEAAEFEKMAHDSTFVHRHGLPGDTLEGFLFPETYQFQKHTPVATILETMIGQYHQVFTLGFRERAAELGWSELQAITLASIIEKETGAPQERSLIAGVFYNRLKRGWPLQTDPTVIYAIVLSRGYFNGIITKADLNLDHRYNTYRYKGLPPGAICNPGAEAIRAALYPETTPYLFFVSKNNGTHQFCLNLACHNRAVAQYQRGGNYSVSGDRSGTRWVTPSRGSPAGAERK
jgi:UPF0755 protein